MKYSVKFIDNFNMLKDLNNIRNRLVNEFEPVQELEKYLLLEEIIDDKIKQIIEDLNEEIEREE